MLQLIKQSKNYNPWLMSKKNTTKTIAKSW